MVDEVIVSEWLGLGPPREVEAARRTVPRHLFAPGVPLEQAYAQSMTDYAVHHDLGERVGLGAVEFFEAVDTGTRYRSPTVGGFGHVGERSGRRDLGI